jgi:hypothetical protein
MLSEEFTASIYKVNRKQLGRNDDAVMTKGQNKGSARQPMGDGSHSGVLLVGKHKKG